MKLDGDDSLSIEHKSLDLLISSIITSESSSYPVALTRPNSFLNCRYAGDRFAVRALGENLLVRNGRNSLQNNSKLCDG